MVFSSNLFLFLFLPVVLAGYYAGPRALRNLWLLAASLVFYGWGGPPILLLLAASIGMNYAFGLAVVRWRKTRAAPYLLTAAVAANLLPLGYYKYGGFTCHVLTSILEPLGFASLPIIDVALPIGISFFTFQAMSYVVDVYRGEVPAARNPIDVALYIVFFPQLIAGPIVRYFDVAEQIRSRRESVAEFAEGVERFVVGLAKKVLLANTLAAAADPIFELTAAELTTPLAWLGLLCYTLQIYYDFSGYSDMAVGLGLMFGFRFVENFNYPYSARSITEFWRRWHISLSVWFRDYVYIPLGGNRVGPWRTYLNLLVVFLLCGLWHGASWNFIVWGLFYGLFLIAERAGLSRVLTRCPAGVARGYTLLTVMAGWVFFRAVDLSQARDYFAALAGWGQGSAMIVEHGFDGPLAMVLAAACVGCVPWLPWLKSRLRSIGSWAPGFAARQSLVEVALGGVRMATLAALMLTASAMLSAATYNPFIYFRF